MLHYIHTENTSKANVNESTFPQTSTPRALLSQELIIHSMLSNKAKHSAIASERLGVRKHLLSLGLKSNLVASILSAFPLPLEVL